MNTKIEELLVRLCSPTLAGLKTGSMFSCNYASRELLYSDIRYWNTRVVSKGLRVLPLRWKDGRALIYIYRPDRLCLDLSQPVAECLLKERGYPCDNAHQCVVCLIQRLNDGKDFPHEIGLFLGYPPDDVEGFIRCNAKCCNCVGDWKVYGDESAARRQFDRYRKCTKVFCDHISRGRSVDDLVVSVRA